jgi:hypothetical protein
MTREHSDQPLYPAHGSVSDTETGAQARACVVTSLPSDPGCVEATLTHLFHGDELGLAYFIRTTQRVETVVHTPNHFQHNGVVVRVIDANSPYSPPKSIRSLADKLNADVIVSSGGVHRFTDNQLICQISKLLSNLTSQPIIMLSEIPTVTIGVRLTFPVILCDSKLPDSGGQSVGRCFNPTGGSLRTDRTSVERGSDSKRGHRRLGRLRGRSI